VAAPGFPGLQLAHLPTRMSPLRIGLIVALPVALAGCTPIQPQGKPLLTPAQMSSESVALEMFFVRCPLGDERANEAMWSEIDEQSLPAPLRRELARNGFRIGLVGLQLPQPLQQLMDLQETSTPAHADKPDPVSLDEPRVMKRHLQIRPGQQSEIVASGVYDEWPVLVCQSGQLSGQTYHQAQGSFGLEIVNERDGRVRLDLTPEMSYGEVRQRWVGNQGMLRLDAGRPKRVFESLAISATLAPGQVLILTCLPNRPGSLGHYFFTDSQSAKLQQKLLLVRLAQTQHHDLIALPDVQPGPEVGGKRSEIGGRGSETGDRRSETGGREKEIRD
jgi:hypothetical protein